MVPTRKVRTGQKLVQMMQHKMKIVCLEYHEKGNTTKIINKKSMKYLDKTNIGLKIVKRLMIIQGI